MKGWVLLPCLLVTITGCGRIVTESDCGLIRDNMRGAWSAEAKKAAPADGVSAEKAAAVIKSEGDKLVGDWMAECKRELMGRRAEPKEMDCLLQAQTISDITRCSEP